MENKIRFANLSWPLKLMFLFNCVQFALVIYTFIDVLFYIFTP